MPTATQRLLTAEVEAATISVMKHLLIMLVLGCGLVLSPALAQTDLQISATLAAGSRTTGRIDDATPRVVYALRGTRGEVLRFRLSRTSGDLDLVLTIFDDRGAVVLQQDDSSNSRDIATTFTFERNSTYYAVVGRFGYELGTTAGDYELTLAREGVLSEQGSTLQYGIPVIGTISSTEPQKFYTFRARAGDIINIEMIRNSGTLDPYLKLVDSDRFLLAENDDFNSERCAQPEPCFNALIDNFLIEETGTYIIVATRYREAAGDTVGNFVLLIDEAISSGLGNTRLAPAPIFFNQTVSDSLTDAVFQQFYQFDAEADQLVTIVMERTGQRGQLDAYVILANSGLQPLVVDDDGGSGSNARISTYRIPNRGRYIIIATRFGEDDGDTFGDYELTLLDAGNAFAGVSANVPRLEYGEIVQGEITVDETEALYAFWGIVGDEVTIRLNRLNNGQLDPVVELLDDDGLRMLRDDNSANFDNALLETTLSYTGVHYIRATRYEGSGKPSDTLGGFSLFLAGSAAGPNE